MSTGKADAKAALARLAEQGQAIILTDPAQVATVLGLVIEAEADPRHDAG